MNSNIKHVDRRGANKPFDELRAKLSLERRAQNAEATADELALLEATRPWIGVDFDGTVAVYPHGKKDPWAAGAPVPRMVRRVNQWLAEGQLVKIITARVSIEEPETLAHNIEVINEFSRENFGQELEITCKKDMFMIAIWDDKAVSVVKNSGVALVLDG